MASAKAQAHIARLDRSLARSGCIITLRRLTLGPKNTQILFDCDAGAVVRDYAPNELVGGIIQGDSRVILSPSPLLKKKWPGPGEPPLPVALRDRTVIAKKERAIQAVTPFYNGDDVVRIELQVRG